MSARIRPAVSSFILASTKLLMNSPHQNSISDANTIRGVCPNTDMYAAWFGAVTLCPSTSNSPDASAHPGAGGMFTTTTDINGYYEFSNVAAGVSYSLTQTSAVGYTPASATPGTVDGLTDGTSASSTQIADINLDWGDLGINYDFFQNVKTPPPA